MVYVYAHIQSVERAKLEVLKAEELSKFNIEFESFNKSSMYGTDIITVLNKAVAINKKYERQMISISLKIDTNFVEYIEYKRLNSTTGKYENESNIEGEKNWAETEKTPELLANSNPYLYKYGQEDNDLMKFITNNKSKSTEYKDDVKTQEFVNERELCRIITPGISEFKNKRFKCTEVLYDSNSGRLYSMSFELI